LTDDALFVTNDGLPLVVGEFVAQRFEAPLGSLNHAPGDAFNSQRPIVADAPTWRELLLLVSCPIPNDPLRSWAQNYDRRPQTDKECGVRHKHSGEHPRVPVHPAIHRVN